MKTIVYPDGSIEATARADEFVAAGRARYATPAEAVSYEAAFERDACPWCGESPADCTLNECPAREG